MFQVLKKFDWILIGAIILILIIGILSIASTSAARTGTFGIVKKQIIFSLVGLFLLFLFGFTDYRFLRNYPVVILSLYALSTALLILLLFLGSKIRGSASWFRFGEGGKLSFEPVEMTKFILIALLAKYFSSRHVDFGLFRHIIISGLYVLVPVILILLQPDLGSAALIIAIWIGIMLVSGIRMRHLLVLSLIFLILTGSAWQFFLKDYQKSRITTFFEPQKDPLGHGYNVAQSIIAIGSGRFWGKGLGHGSQSQLNFLPEQHTDFILATIAEEWGFLGVSFILILWGIIFWRLFIAEFNASTNFARLFIVGFMILLLSHISINIGMNMGFMPITGIPLPMLSYGGSNLIITLIAFGVIQNIKISSQNI